MPPRRRIISPIPAIPAGSWAATGNRFTKLLRPRTVPQQAFTRAQRLPIGAAGIAQGIIAAGTAQVSTGPQGVGTRWYPQQVTIATASGAADASTCTIYLTAVVSSAIVGQSYAGGGDTIGLAVPEMQPGDLLIAVWSGGHNGDWASVNVIGDQRVLGT